MIANYMLDLLRRALKSAGFCPGVGLVVFVDSIPPFVETQTPLDSKT